MISHSCFRRHSKISKQSPKIFQRIPKLHWQYEFCWCISKLAKGNLIPRAFPFKIQRICNQYIALHGLFLFQYWVEFTCVHLYIYNIFLKLGWGLLVQIYDPHMANWSFGFSWCWINLSFRSLDGRLLKLKYYLSFWWVTLKS